MWENRYFICYAFVTLTCFVFWESFENRAENDLDKKWTVLCFQMTNRSRKIFLLNSNPFSINSSNIKLSRAFSYRDIFRKLLKWCFRLFGCKLCIWNVNQYEMMLKNWTARYPYLLHSARTTGSCSAAQLQTEQYDCCWAISVVLVVGPEPWRGSSRLSRLGRKGKVFLRLPIAVWEGKNISMLILTVLLLVMNKISRGWISAKDKTNCHNLQLKIKTKGSLQKGEGIFA